MIALSNPCRYESNSGGEREIQRTMLELLNQLDGFDSKGDVKVIYSTPVKYTERDWENSTKESQYVTGALGQLLANCMRKIK